MTQKDRHYSPLLDTRGAAGPIALLGASAIGWLHVYESVATACLRLRHARRDAQVTQSSADTGKGAAGAEISSETVGYLPAS